MAAAPKEKKKGKVGKKPKAEPKPKKDEKPKAEPKKAGSELGKAMDEALGSAEGTFDREAKEAQAADETTVGDAVAPKRPGPGEAEMDESRTGHTEDFETRAKAALAKALNVEPDDLTEGKTYFPFDEKESVSFEGAGGEYTVFNEEDADDIAKASVRNDFEGPHAEGFDLFNPDFLMRHVDQDALTEYMTQVFQEFAEQDAGELSVSEKEEWLREKGYLNDVGDETPEEAAVTGVFENHADEWKEAYVEERLGSDSGQSWWEDNVGEEDFRKIVKDQNLYDIDAIVEGAVQEDGAGHFMSSYDGQFHEMDGGLAYVRTN